MSDLSEAVDGSSGGRLLVHGLVILAAFLIYPAYGAVIVPFFIAHLVNFVVKSP